MADISPPTNPAAITNSPPILYSVVVPVFNSAVTLQTLFERLKAVFDRLKAPFELILIDDGSHDDSWPKIVTLCTHFPAIVRGVRLSRNFGQHNAILCGLAKTKGRFVITIDDDLQVPPEEIIALIEHQKQTNADCTYGLPAETHYGLIRNWGSTSMQWVVRQAFGYKGRVGPFRLLHNTLVRKIIRHNAGFIFIDGYILWHTQHIGQVTIKKQPRPYGKSGYNFWALLRLMLLLIISYTVLPVYLLFGLSAFCGILGVGISLYNYALRHYFLYSHLTVLSLMLILCALILLGLGIVASYLQRLSQMHYSAPVYSVERAINL